MKKVITIMAIFFTSWAHAQNDSVIITHHQDTSRQWLLQLLQDSSYTGVGIHTISFNSVDTMALQCNTPESIEWARFYLCTRVKVDHTGYNRVVESYLVYAKSKKEATRLFNKFLARCNPTWKTELLSVHQMHQQHIIQKIN